MVARKSWHSYVKCIDMKSIGLEDKFEKLSDSTVAVDRFTRIVCSFRRKDTSIRRRVRPNKWEAWLYMLGTCRRRLSEKRELPATRTRNSEGSLTFTDSR